LTPAFRVWLRVLRLGEQLGDKDRQEELVKASGLEWTLIQPVGFTDGAATKEHQPVGSAARTCNLPSNRVAEFI
jgi:uncharacterized protein YbjT (DUF2867 family)